MVFLSLLAIMGRAGWGGIFCIHMLIHFKAKTFEDEFAHLIGLLESPKN